MPSDFIRPPPADRRSRSRRCRPRYKASSRPPPFRQSRLRAAREPAPSLKRTFRFAKCARFVKESATLSDSGLRFLFSPARHVLGQLPRESARIARKARAATYPHLRVSSQVALFSAAHVPGLRDGLRLDLVAQLTPALARPVPARLDRRVRRGLLLFERHTVLEHAHHEAVAPPVLHSNLNFHWLAFSAASALSMRIPS